MTESLCWCCKLFGKASRRINFIIVTGAAHSLIYERVKCIFRNDSYISSSTDGIRLRDYKTLTDINDTLFNDGNHSSSIDQAVSTPMEACCNGSTVMPNDIEDVSNSLQLDTFKKQMIELLRSKVEEKSKERRSKSWILLSGSIFLEPPLLNIFLQFTALNSLSSSFTLTVLCFLVKEARLFENWLPHHRSIQDYQEHTFREYDTHIRNFFLLLNSSKYLQDNTLLVDEGTILNDSTLQALMQGLFRKESSKYRASDKQLLADMAKLLSPVQRTIRDIFVTRRDLKSHYHRRAKIRLEPLFHDLQQSSAAVNAARQIANIVLDDFKCMNDGELKAYRKLCVCGFQNHDLENGNTIAAQLVHLAVYLLKNNNDDGSIPLIYSIVLAICEIGAHFYLRHDLFNHTSEIYTLSLLLVSQRQYPLTLSGLRLCNTILKADQNEYKYVTNYLTHDALTARKILNAIIWLLSPYQTLKKIWEESKEEQENEYHASESTKTESAVYISERDCFRHAEILISQPCISNLASLFYGSVDNCMQLTQDDVYQLTEVIDVLTDSRLLACIQGEYHCPPSVVLVSELCALLKPILLYSSPSVCLALINQNNILSTVPKTVQILLQMNEVYKNLINLCINFYIQFIEQKCKQKELRNDTKNQENIEFFDAKTTEQSIDSFVSLNLSRDLISSYFDLYRKIQKASSLDEKSIQEEQIQELFNEEWKRFDTLQLQNENEQVKQELQSLHEELLQLRSELQRTQLERDNFRKENNMLHQEIDKIKLMPTAMKNVEFRHLSTFVSTDKNNDKNTIDELQNLSPNEITSEQAEKCIQQIYYRRTTFNDNDMRKSICGSLKHLGSDLYTSPVHFLHELIQNAEDNFYEPSIIPCLRIELNHGYILLSNNEQGLRARDVFAICSLAVSTKTIEQEHIGEKGVGFKSVFGASNEPMLISHAWKFHFHVPGLDAMSYITPLWITDKDLPKCISKQISTFPQYTHLYLPLKFQAHTSEANSFLDQVIKAVDPCILLNMRQLKKLEIVDERQKKVTIIEKQFIGSTKLEEQSSVTFEDFTFLHLSGSVIRLHTSTGYSTFRVYTCYINVTNYIEQGRPSKTRLTIGFPCENDYELTSTVYKGLPVCDLGFNFLFNADFQLVKNRENVQENVPFNTFLRTHLSALFVYLLLNDIDLRKDFNRYCPLFNINQGKHSSWWLLMIDYIKTFVNKYLPILLNIPTDKNIRYINRDLALLASNEQLCQCANIYVIDPENSFSTLKRLKSFQIQAVSIIDVLECFPRREEISINTFRQQFRLWTQQQDQQWWSQFFHHLSQMMTSEISLKLLQIPIFLLQNDGQRQYLPINNNTQLLLFISNDPKLRMWKKQITLLQYSSESEKIALAKMNQIQFLTEKRMIEIIRQHHLQLAASSSQLTDPDVDLILEIWKDLSYLKSHIDNINNSSQFLVPAIGTPKLTPIQNAMSPTIFGIDIRKFIHPTALIIDVPYNNVHQYQLLEILEWEHFLLEMHCQKASIVLPLNYSIKELPLLPVSTIFNDEKCAHLGELILSYQRDDTKHCLRQFPIVDNSKDKQQISPVSATFDETIVINLPTLPRITIPHYCRALAKSLDICVEYDLRTCANILQLLSDEKNTNTDLYVKWLGHLQLYVLQQHIDLNRTSLLSSCRLYFPEQNNFYSLNEVFIISNSEEYSNAISIISKYLKLQLISPLINQTYWQFKDLFHLLNCKSISTITFVLHLISQVMTKITSLLGNATNTDLYKTVVINKHSKAFCGSREDLAWRFSLTCDSLSQELQKLTSIQSQRKKIRFVTFNRQIISKEIDTTIYACLEIKIIQNLSRDSLQCYFMLPSIARTCPLVLATFGIDYIERKGKIEWLHGHNNPETYLNELTQIFRATLDDKDLEVVSAVYATVGLFLPDSFVIDSTTENRIKESKRYWFDSNYPFWVFNNIILLCNEQQDKDASREIRAISALTTILHKRKHIPFEEAKSIAQKNISKCKAFRSENMASVTCTGATIYSFTDMLFPTDHNYVESIIISIGKNTTIEKDIEKTTRSVIAADRIAEDQIYRYRVKTQDHSQRSRKTINDWKDPSIVDGIEQMRIGQNAEHFFFVYLQNLYGSADVTPTKNWRSSSRLTTYPKYRQTVDDSTGFDFELHDTRQLFVRGSGSTTKLCYFEVKGTSGSFNETHSRFYISQNELYMCQSIVDDSQRREHEAYFIVVIENCLDAEKIAFGTVFNWSDNFHKLDRSPETYRCRIISSSLTNVSNSKKEETRDYNNDQQQQRMKTNNRYGNSTTQNVSTKKDDAASRPYAPPYRRNPD
ncbi:unnamed protein product [Rotaria socialis]